jgi:hypothetical protein
LKKIILNILLLAIIGLSSGCATLDGIKQDNRATLDGIEKDTNDVINATKEAYEDLTK